MLVTLPYYYLYHRSITAMSLYALSLLALTSLVSAATNSPTSGVTYTISPASHPDLCVVPAGDYDGARLTLADCDDSDQIAWTFNGQSLTNTAVDRCVDVMDGGHWNGNGLQAWECFDHNTNQRFSPSSGTIKWTGTGMCLDLTDGNAHAGTMLQLWQCFDGNTNQQWSFEQVQEVEDCDTTTSAVAGASTTVAASASSTIGGGLWVTGTASSSASASADWSASSTSANWSASSSSADWSASATASSSSDWSATSVSSAAASASATVGTGGSGSSDFSGYLQVSGTNVVDPSGNNIQLKGTNLGGWLVWEDWMCGITDNSGSADRFPQTTLENRFGETQTRELMKVWQDNWLVSSDFDILKNMGFNVLRLPFSYRNFIRSDGTWITDSSGNLDLSRLDWAIAQAKSRGMYVIPTYHIWDGQEQRYSTVSEDSSDGQAQRDKMGALWTVIAKHFAGESAIAGFDAINEPTGSANNNLQRDLYNAIRAGDSKRIIIMESIANQPDSDWTNVMYSMHEYLMMGENDDGYNQWMFQQGVRDDTNQYTSVGVPTYIGEFMASGNTLSWMLDQMNNMGVSGLHRSIDIV